MKFEKSFGCNVIGKKKKLHIVLLGTGGTGGNVLAQIAKIKALGVDNSKLLKFDLTLVDGDLVESKNVKRQPFFDMDVGRNKAQVLSERYSEVYGTDIAYSDKYLESIEDMKEIMSSDGNIPVLVGCVDNHKTRQLIDSYFIQTSGMFWIDSGNEEFNGQVVCGYSNKHTQRQIRRVADTVEKRMKILSDNMKKGKFDLPTITELFPEILANEKTKFNSELSCAERAESAPQNIFVNNIAAQFIMLYLRKILTASPITSHCVMFSIEAVNSRTTYNTLDNMERVLKNWDAKNK